MKYKLLSSGDEKLLEASERGVFDHDIQPELGSQFLSDPRHHIAVAIEDSIIVGFASAVRYIHPDKPDELWINEVAVGKAYRLMGIADTLLKLLFQCGRGLGCREAWVLADESNIPANQLYSKLGGVPQKQILYSFELGDNDRE
jgi:GNAT superfamily N-acetyltransferase